MTNISYFINIGLFTSIVNLSWSVIFAHFGEAKLPISLIFSAQGSMTLTKNCSSLISKPHIVSSSYQLESWSQVWFVDDPTVSRISNSMLKENYWSFWLGIGSIDSEYIENVAISGGHRMRRIDEAII